MAILTAPLRAEQEQMDGFFGALVSRIGPQKYNAWFKHGTRAVVEDGHVRILVPNPFVANWIEAHYQADMVAAVQEHLGREMPVVVTVDPSLSGSLRKTQLDNQAQLVAKASQGHGRVDRATPQVQLRHKLEDFIVGESNRLAHSAALQVATGQNAAFNTLFVHGPCGVGKTHLLQGICNLASKRTGQVRWRYVTGEQFTNEFITSLRAKKLEEFRSRYRKLDLLAIDDVHFLAAKKATQDEFLHTFVAIESAGKTVVMASDAHPRLVGDLNDGLVSRFMSGMVVKVSAPDFATRMSILTRRSQQMKLSLTPDVLEYVGRHVRGSVRELEGTLIKLTALSALEKGPVTLSLATEALADHMARTESVITVGDIEAAAAAFFGITPADIHSSRRTKTVSVARMVAMFLARRHTRMSYPEIGRFMGKNHSSAVLAVQRLEAILKSTGELEWLTPIGIKTMPAAKVVEMLTEQLS